MNASSSKEDSTITKLTKQFGNYEIGEQVDELMRDESEKGL